MFVQNIDPELLKIGPISIRYYGVCYATGIYTAYLIARHFYRKKGYPDEILDKMLLWIVIGLILGAHFFHLIFYEPQGLLSFKRIISLGTGLASHGGLLGTFLAMYIFCKRNKLKFWEQTDLITVGGSALAPFIRLGNFFNSEIYGRPTDLPWGVIFKQRGLTEPRHPSQIYELLINLAIAILLFMIYKKYWKRIKSGGMFFLFLLLYFVTRFLIEYVKEYQALSSSFPLTMGQILSIPFVILSIVVLIKGRYYKLLDPSETPKTLP